MTAVVSVFGYIEQLEALQGGGWGYLDSIMNPCPCSYYGDPVKSCTCSPMLVSRYQKRISGPLLDRIDIFVEVPRIDYEKLADDRMGESSVSVC